MTETIRNTPRDYAQAAAELGVSQAWLEEHTPSIPLPHSKFAVDDAGKPSRRGRGAVRFYDEGHRRHSRDVRRAAERAAVRQGGRDGHPVGSADHTPAVRVTATQTSARNASGDDAERQNADGRRGAAARSQTSPTTRPAPHSRTPGRANAASSASTNHQK